MRHEREPLELFTEGFRRYGDLVRFRMGPRPFYMVCHPDLIRRFLAENAVNYPRESGLPGPLLGNGLFESEGEYWRRQRRLIQPAFHRERLRGLVADMARSIQRMLDGWDARAGQPFDMAEEMGRLSIRLVGRAVYSGEPDDALCHALRRLAWLVNNPRHWLVQEVTRRLAINTARRQEFLAHLGRLDALAADVIARRRAGGPEDDAMSVLVAAKDRDTGEGMTDKELRDEFMNLFAAGHEATGTALTWAWYLLAEHPEVAERLASESAAVLGGRAPTAEDLPRLRYATQVFEETLRLYPPAWRVTRVAVGADKLGGHDVAPGTVVSAISYVVHRHPAFWESPETFDPDRFAPERAQGRHKFSYLPFGAGQHICVGNNLALLKGTLALAMAAQRFRAAVAPGWKVAIQPGIVLQPRGGLPMTVSPRS
ncbi:cytochrome P450 [Pyxidicoccus fallax]|uniref:Cytochrome P450 n=1 Tax=Pyxidicoccus fallax TaxID=394095 RepID=A0A848LR60_9BACT|nr:cytochrome P450 [Pyxidicoccus fallax]NPC80852.1 cytochrome P450 [Pyxidicoccus fallax]